MIRFDNPIFITQRRLIKRNAFLAVMLGALGLGAMIVLAEVNALDRVNSPARRMDLSLIFYAWILALQGFLAVVAAGARLARGIADEQRSGRLEVNRLTPMSTAQLLVGYTLGLPFLFALPALALAPFGAVVLLLGEAPLYVFVNSQLLLFSTALITWLTTLILGLAYKKNQAGSMVLVLMLFAGFPLAAEVGGAFIGTFLVPLFPVLADFAEAGMGRMENTGTSFFGLPIPRLAMAFGVQGIFGVILWRAARRKIRDPDVPALSMRLAIIAFALLALGQHGLAWSELQGGSVRHVYQGLTVTQGGLIFAGIMMLLGLGANPSRLRRLVIQDPGGEAFLRQSRKGLITAVIMASITAGFLGLHVFALGGEQGARALIAALSAFSVLVGLAAALDIGAFAFGAQARSAVVGLFFLLVIATLVVGAISGSESFMVVTNPLIDGIFALGSSKQAFQKDPGFLLGAGALFHLAVTAGLLVVRQRMAHLQVAKIRAKG
jgi:hypothetical protein